MVVVAVFLVTRLASHNYPPSVIFTSAVRVWDIGAELLPVVEHEWAPRGDTIGALESLLVRESPDNDVDIDALAGAGSYIDDVRRVLRRVLRHRVALTARWQRATVSAVIDVVAACTPGASADTEYELRPPRDMEAFADSGDGTTVEITFEDGTVELGVEPHLLRRPAEAQTYVDGPPAWLERDAAVPRVGTQVALWQRDECGAFVSLFEKYDSDGSGMVPLDKFELVIALLLNSDDGGDDDGAEEKGSRITVGHVLSVARMFEEIVSGGDNRLSYLRFAAFIMGSTPQLCRYTIRTAVSSTQQHGAPRVSFAQAWVPVPVPTKRILYGVEAGVTALTYLPSSQLIVASSRDGRIVAWDPLSHSHRLVLPFTHPHMRLWPGEYGLLKPEWTAPSTVSHPVISFNVDNGHAVASDPAVASEAASGSSGGSDWVCLSLSSATLPTAFPSCYVEIDQGKCDQALAVDEQVHEAEGKGVPPCRGFLYLLENGQVLAIAAAQFERRFVLLNDPAFFEVNGVLAAGTGKGSTDKHEMRHVFRSRELVRRIAYVVSYNFPSLGALRRAIASSGAFASGVADLERFSGQFVVFGCRGDDGTAAISVSSVKTKKLGRCMQEIDSDGDGEVSFAEFVRFRVTFSKGGGGGGFAGGRKRQAIVLLRKVFDSEERWVWVWVCSWSMISDTFVCVRVCARACVCV